MSRTLSHPLIARIALLAALVATPLPAQAQEESPHWKLLRDDIRARQVEERRGFSSMTREEREALREKHRAEDRAWQRERDEYLKERPLDDADRGRSGDHREDDRHRSEGYSRGDDERYRGDDRYDDSDHGRKQKQKQKGKNRD